MKMKDLDSMNIEKIIRLPFFHSLEKDTMGVSSPCWKVTFRCNKTMAAGGWALLDEFSDNEYIVRYKIIDINY